MITIIISFEDGEDMKVSIPFGGSYHWNNIEKAKIQGILIVT